MSTINNNYPFLETEAEPESQTIVARWFAEQQTKSIDNLEAAARQIITLCTTLLGALLGLMALTESPLPAHMRWSGIQWLSGAGVVGFFVALACAIIVIYPFPRPLDLGNPDEIQQNFASLLALKDTWLRAAVITFAAGMLCIMLVVVVSLLYVV